MAPSWLTALSSHSIFTLPSDSTSSAPQALSTHPSLSELARPASPDLPPIFPSSPASHRRTLNGGGLTQSASSKSLFGLSSPSRSRLASFSTARRAPREEERKGVGRVERVVLVRGVDLVVAVGSELRIASLADVKARVQQRSRSRSDVGLDELAQEVALGDYKTLHTPNITFPIQQLVVNPTSKLLAVIGAHSVAVVVLPRNGWASSVGRELECRSLLVGKFYHAIAGSPLVSQALWHPWGSAASSLLVLTLDGLVREYNISSDVEEPTQTVSLVPAGEQSGGFSAVDEGASKAVAMCLGEGKGDWSAMTLFGLMRNGDVVALCPFLPKKASIPSSYIHSLSCFVSTKVDYLSSHSTSSNALTLASSTSSPFPSQSTFSALYPSQLQYLNSLVRQASTQLAVASPSSSSPLDNDDARDDPLIEITPPPTRSGAQAVLQGPFLLQPSPPELDNGLDSFATDLVYLSPEEGESAGVGVLGVAYSDGKVDWCIEVEKVEARWGASAYLDEEDSLPSLVVYESIDLGFADELAGSANEVNGAEGGYPTFVKDPLYGSDTVYIKHGLGAHCIGVGKWVEEVQDVVRRAGEGDGDDEEALARETERTLRRGVGSEVVWIVKTRTSGGADQEERGSTPGVAGLALLNDVYLGYSLLVVTSSLQFVGIELSLRVSPLAAGSSPPLNAVDDTSDDAPAYVSLLSTPFSLPPNLGITPLPRLALPKSSAAGKSLETITPDSLRFLGQTVEKVNDSIRELVRSADTVQCRLELQMKELSRQLAKVAELSALSSTTSTSSADAETSARLAKAQAIQHTLLTRTDQLLQRLMDSHSPSLSSFEKKWFDELGRLEGEVERLQARGERVEGRVEDLVERARSSGFTGKKESERRDGSSALGEGQKRAVEGALGEEAKLIAEARKKVELLSKALSGVKL